jgi:myo-inositol 2-dehydrogenase / D-chiro-inositol 1-dehydrogenase
VPGSRVGLALVGAGDIARRGHLPAIAANADAELVAVVEPDPERLASVAVPPGAVRAADLAAALELPGVDAVVVATPPAATAAVVSEALAAGKYVLAEKPLAPSLAEACRVAAAPHYAERLQIGLTYRHHPAVERLRELVAAGAFGLPLVIRNTISDEPAAPESDPVAHSRRLRSLEHATPMVSDGVHACDRLNLLLGEDPAEVAGWALRTDPAYAAPNIVGAVMTYADGTIARLEVIWLLPVLPASSFTLAGPRGLAVLDPPTFALRVELADGGVEELEPPGDKTETCFALQLERFLMSCRSGRPPTPGLREALASLDLAERCSLAATGVPTIAA